MPYRHAHWWLIALLATIPLAFWPNYFSPAAHRTIAMHSHAAAATLWLALLIAQSWSAQRRAFGWHRRYGRAVFVVVPLFAAAGAMAIVDMARRFAAQSDPFHAVTGATLAMCDIIALIAFVALVTRAVATRRRMRHHAAAMLATALLVLPPVAARLLQHVPGWPDDGAFGLSGFALSLHVTEWGAAAACYWLYRQGGRDAAPFLFAGLACVVQSLLYPTLAATDGWAAATRSLATIPLPLAAVLGALCAGAALRLAWVRPTPPQRMAPA